jgi:hypothetical protein
MGSILHHASHCITLLLLLFYQRGTMLHPALSIINHAVAICCMLLLFAAF